MTRWLVVLLAFACGLAEAGTTGLVPHFPHGAPQRVIGFRYKVIADTPDHRGGPIVYGMRSFYNPDSSEPWTFYDLQSNIYSAWIEHPVDVCSEQQTGVIHFGEIGLWVSVPDPAGLGRVGIQWIGDRAARTFSRHQGSIDRFPGASKIETIYQGDLSREILEVTVLQGPQVVGPAEGWGSTLQPNTLLCDPTLPLGITYRQWDILVTIGWQGQSQFVGRAVLPEAQARYLAPDRMIEFISENLSPGVSGPFKLAILLPEYRTDGGEWQPVRAWRVRVKADRPDISHPTRRGWGVRRGDVIGFSYIEFSNDGSDTYLGVGGMLTLDQTPPCGQECWR